MHVGTEPGLADGSGQQLIDQCHVVFICDHPFIFLSNWNSKKFSFSNWMGHIVFLFVEKTERKWDRM